MKKRIQVIENPYTCTLASGKGDELEVKMIANITGENHRYKVALKTDEAVLLLKVLPNGNGEMAEEDDEEENYQEVLEEDDEYMILTSLIETIMNVE